MPQFGPGADTEDERGDPREDVARPDLMATVMGTARQTCWCRALMLEGARIRTVAAAPLFVLVYQTKGRRE